MILLWTLVILSNAQSRAFAFRWSDRFSNVIDASRGWNLNLSLVSESSTPISTRFMELASFSSRDDENATLVIVWAPTITAFMFGAPD
jgi:hypothetical protein